MMIESHPFAPFVPKRATVLIVGSFPGREQTRRPIDYDNEWVYGAKRNQFWKILELVYDIKLPTKQARQELFTRHGIAITDLFLKARRREGTNADSNLEVIEYNDKAIAEILESSAIETILFSSQFVQKEYMKLFPTTTNGVCLPSPSPRYARMSVEEKAAYYRTKLPVYNHRVP